MRTIVGIALMFLFSFLTQAQTKTLYYTDKWEISSKEQASLYRICEIGQGFQKNFFSGKVEDYTIDGKLVMKGSYTELGLKNGEFTIYYPSGQLQAQGKFKNDFRTGIWRYYYENGKLDREVKFSIQQVYQTLYSAFEPISAYDSTGKVFIEDGTGDWHYEYEWYGVTDRYIVTGKVKNGKKDGLWTCTLNNGQLLYRENYKNDSFKEGIIIEDGNQKPLTAPIENKFMLPYKFEVTETFVSSPSATYTEYPFLLFLPIPQKNSPNDEAVFATVEKVAEFPGGMSAMMKFVKKNQIYPKTAQRMGVEGKVYVVFIVEKDGSISNVKIHRGINGDLDKEAIRIVSMFPKWNPGMQNGQAVKSQFILPIPFNLN